MSLRRNTTIVEGDVLPIERRRKRTNCDLKTKNEHSNAARNLIIKEKRTHNLVCDRGTKYA